MGHNFWDRQRKERKQKATALLCADAALTFMISRERILQYLDILDWAILFKQGP